MSPYGYHWRTAIRPRILERDHHLCRRCSRGGRLDVAHLDGDNSHDDDANLASMCRTCHCRLDYPVAQAKAYETRCDRKDRERPLLRTI
jgi:hypothetical protein